jgi:hypothetical protein
MLGSDDRTLRLAAPEVTPEKVEAFLRYQRALCARPDAELADAHAAALAKSGLDGNAHARLNSVAQAYCGRVQAARRLRSRIETLRQGSPNEQALARKAALEVARLEDLSDLARRYGADALACLGAREAALLEAHEAVVRRLTACAGAPGSA